MTSTPFAKLSLLALECRDPHALAAFYQAIVGGSINPVSESIDWVRLELPGTSDLGFQRDPGYEPLTWPDGPSQQAHLDLEVDDLDAAEAAVLALGARKASLQVEPASWRVLIDPEGHPFCLIKR